MSVGKDGLGHVKPDREARIGQLTERGERRRSDFDSTRSYYGQPILNRPTWKPLDIAGYLFFGGLAGASSTLAAAADLTGRPTLARSLRFGAAGAIGVSAAALVHDLGRPSRFYNMLRVFKPTSPMSVGSWLLAAYGPAAIGAAVMDSHLPLPVPAAARRPLTTALGLAAAAVGPAVATYTGVLVADTAVPAWHGGYKEMPFLFAASASAAAGGLGLVTASFAGPPPGRSQPNGRFRSSGMTETRHSFSEAGPARRLAVTGAVAELAMGRIMRSNLGIVAETYEQGEAGRLIRAAEALTATGAVLAVAGRRSRPLGVAAGAALLAGSALTRFGVFHAGVASVEDPKYVVDTQKN